MRRVRTTGGVLIAVASLVLVGCGSSGSPAASTPSTERETTAAPRASTTTRPKPPTTVAPAAADAVAQFALTSALDAAKKTYDDTYDFTDVSPASLTSALPSMHFAPLDQASTTVVGVLAQDKNDVLLVTKSASGRWYCITDNDEDGTSYGVARALADINSNGECQLDAWPAPGTAG